MPCLMTVMMVKVTSVPILIVNIVGRCFMNTFINFISIAIFIILLLILCAGIAGLVERAMVDLKPTVVNCTMFTEDRRCEQF